MLELEWSFSSSRKLKVTVKKAQWKNVLAVGNELEGPTSDSSLQTCGPDLAFTPHGTLKALTGFWQGDHRLDGGSYDCDHWLLLRCCIWKTMLHHDQTDDQGLMNVECSPPLHVPRVCVRTWASWGHEASLRVNELSAWGVGALEADKLPPPTQGQFSENSSKMSWSGRSVCQEFLEK